MIQPVLYCHVIHPHSLLPTQIKFALSFFFLNVNMLLDVYCWFFILFIKYLVNRGKQGKYF